jgi:hypothetical protein
MLQHACSAPVHAPSTTICPCPSLYPTPSPARASAASTSSSLCRYARVACGGGGERGGAGCRHYRAAPSGRAAGAACRAACKAGTTARAATHSRHPIRCPPPVSHLAGPGEQLADALEDGVGEGVGGKGDDQALVRQGGEVRHHAVHLVLRRGSEGSRGWGRTGEARRGEHRAEAAAQPSPCAAPHPPPALPPPHPPPPPPPHTTTTHTCG